MDTALVSEPNIAGSSPGKVISIHSRPFAETLIAVETLITIEHRKRITIV